MSLVEKILKFKFYFFIVIFIIFQNGYCSPAIPTNVSREFHNNNNNNNNGPFDSDIWSLIDRQPGLPDIILPSLCPSPCINLFKAQMYNITGAECACRCSTTSPGFVQSIGQCSSKLEECQNPVRFEGNVDSSLLPLFTLPAPQGVIGSKANILWHEAKIKLIPSVGARCNISGVYYLKDDRLWQEAAPSLFYIDWFEDNAKLFWNGTILEAKQLEGTIIQLKLDCFGHSRNAHCLSFRIAGQTGPLLSKRNNNSGQSTTGYQGRFETIVIIFLIILIFLVIFGAIVSWQICWGLKKSELISNIQMRILYQMKQDKDKEALENSNNNHRYQSISRNSHNNNNSQLNEEIIDETKSGDMVQHGIVKRKLFFSAEFFEPHFMMNPPPMAEQFLHDLRKMIDLAKHRIHGRKHIPQLVSIPEETKEHYEPYMELHNRPNNLQVTTPTSYAAREEENSPKSVKSCDSGRESMRDASSTESVASSTDSNAPKARSPIPILPNGGVKNLVHEFEPPKQESKNRKPASRIPVITGFAKSPKLPSKSHPISIAQQKTFAEVPPLPPRNRPTSPLNNISNNNNNNNNNNNCVTPPPPPLPSSPPPTRISAANGIPQPVGHARRKTYAVFPTDPMLKKSLPRRTKKKPLPPTNGIIETNM